MDFYALKKGKYDIESFFKADGGIYGLFQKNAVIAYVAGIVVQIPLLASGLYTGPMAEAPGGLDIGWVIGPVVTAAIYYARATSGRASNA
ncbi:hypothetical protein [Falsirhodobacter sp. 1013]|uniref:hypothetical protein n=1 Tax=Falsirhodobacter sp. 1013 TaxID=3417566 RepID=UPI003EB71115